MHRRDLLRLVSLSVLAGATGCDGQFDSPRPEAFSPQAAAGTAFVPDVEMVLTAAPDEVAVLPGAPTRVWRFTGRLLKGPADTLQTLPGSYLGPAIRLRRGQKVRVRFANQLAEDSIVHWHGLDVPESADGHPRLAIGHGREYVYEFEVTNRAGTYWYHPHPHMRTGAQVYQGLAGVLLIHDDEEDRLALPSGEAELLCVIQDRQFDARNQLVFHGGAMMEMMNGFLGDRVLVNGQPQPTTEVDAAWHRVRVVNASNARIYKLAWTGDVQMAVIGGDGGLLETPAAQHALTLAPGQRADVLLDLTSLAAGTDVHLESQAFAEADASAGAMMGMMGGGMRGMRGGAGMMGGRSNMPNGAPLRVMTLRTRARKGPAFRVPERLSSFDATWSPTADAPIRRVPLTFQRMEWSLGGRTFDMSEVALDETVAAGSTHLWDFVNLANPMGMEAAHPIHLHGRQFRVIDGTGGRATNTLRDGIVDGGWRDTVLVLPGETVRVQVTFTHHPGVYLYHCHILEHEDMGMMRNFRVTERRAFYPLAVVSASIRLEPEITETLRQSMEHSPYGFSVTLPVPFDTAVADATAALKAEGFGVLTSIDVQHTLKTKLNRDFRKYMILGACNPVLADRALQAELEIGLLLPCNVIIYETATEQSVVAAMAPLAALGVVGPNPVLQEVAREADERLRRALVALESAASK